jgi:hypothetical protein
MALGPIARPFESGFIPTIVPQILRGAQHFTRRSRRPANRWGAHGTLARSLRRRRQAPKPGEVDLRQPVVLSPLPYWKHLAPEVYRSRVADLLRGIGGAAVA